MQDNHNNEGTFVTNKAVEIGVALIILAFGAIVMWDSHRIGAGWDADGPQSGAFPFYVGLLIVISAVVTIFNAFRENDKEEFVGRQELKQVASVFLPTIVYIFAIGYLGTYVASAIFITIFMVWQGKFSIVKSLAVGIPINVLFFFMFEVWFQVPLPKGWLEAQFGY